MVMNSKNVFIDEEFLLESDVARKLFHGYAKNEKIIDYHCHLSPKEIYEDKKFRDITDIWLGGDHYKWRLMRAYGIDESYITGDKPSYEKFLKWAEVVQTLIGNPLYHWTHLELKRFFGIDELLSPKTAKVIFDEANICLAKLSARKLIEMSNVEMVVTTDDPIDDLKYHDLIKSDSGVKFKVLPAFRPDKAVNIELSWFVDWIDKLASVVGYKIESLFDLEKALASRIDFFHQKGCRLADHALDVILYADANSAEVESIFKKGLKKESLSELDIMKYKGYMMVFFGKTYKKYGWTQQYHIGALRNVSTRMLKELGPDTGFDAINDGNVSIPLSRLLNALDSTDSLPKTIIYTLNKRDFEVAVTIMQGFQGGNIPGKIQFGAAWWFLDTMDGMKDQMKALANNGLLAKFVGMLTDSRSFLSYPRHEYFRRILCNLIGKWVEKGFFPEDYSVLGKIISDISYWNAKNYFQM